MYLQFLWDCVNPWNLFFKKLIPLRQLCESPKRCFFLIGQGKNCKFTDIIVVLCILQHWKLNSPWSAKQYFFLYINGSNTTTLISLKIGPDSTFLYRTLKMLNSCKVFSYSFIASTVLPFPKIQWTWGSPWAPRTSPCLLYRSMSSCLLHDISSICQWKHTLYKFGHFFNDFDCIFPNILHIDANTDTDTGANFDADVIAIALLHKSAVALKIHMRIKIPLYSASKSMFIQYS